MFGKKRTVASIMSTFGALAAELTTHAEEQAVLANQKRAEAEKATAEADAAIAERNEALLAAGRINAIAQG